MSTIAETLAEAIELHKRGELARAEPIYRRILTQQPRHAQALNMLGLLVLQTSRTDEALALLEQSVAIDPAPAVLGNLGAAYQLARRAADALATYERALAIEPDNPGLLYSRGLALADLGRLYDAVASYRRALAAGGDNPRVLNNAGDTERQAGLYDEALAHLDRAVALDPGYVNAHYNRSLVLLTLGRLGEGFAENEWRLRAREFAPRNFPQPAWDGAPLADKTLLVYAEQGLGDTIQFARYLPLVSERVRHVRVEVQPALVPHFEAFGVPVVPLGEPLPPFDVQVSLASLPHVFGTTLETIPAAVPYLTVAAPRVERWHGELARYDGLKVGIVWQGSPSYREDRFRSIPLAAFAPLAEVARVRLFSLQKGPGSEQLAGCAEAFRIVDLGGRSDNDSATFTDTAAIMRNLDLVVTSDTSCAHLAGALNVPVWLALSTSPSWRWLVDRADSPWYPSARLFRQSAPGDWASVFRAMAGELRDSGSAV